MRGSYRMMDWEIEKWTGIIFRDIEKLLCGVEKEIKYTECNLCAYNIENILECLDYVYVEEDINHHDFWFFYENPHTEVKITVFTNVDTAELTMYLTEVEK